MPRTIRLRFDTDATRRMREVQQFYLDNDGFYGEQKRWLIHVETKAWRIPAFC